jgi:hypothetical protein
LWRNFERKVEEVVGKLSELEWSLKGVREREIVGIHSRIVVDLIDEKLVQIQMS